MVQLAEVVRNLGSTLTPGRSAWFRARWKLACGLTLSGIHHATWRTSYLMRRRGSMRVYFRVRWILVTVRRWKQISLYGWRDRNPNVVQLLTRYDLFLPGRGVCLSGMISYMVWSQISLPPGNDGYHFQSIANRWRHRPWNSTLERERESPPRYHLMHESHLPMPPGNDGCRFTIANR